MRSTPGFDWTDDNVAMVVDICRRLDGIPLAIELAAARVPLLGVHGLHARLNQIFNVLTGGTRMKLRRHQTLRAALEWSHGLLSADEQTVFRRLGVFAGGFTLELAQQVVSDERIDQWLVLDLLGHLVDKSLVIADGEAEPRYRLLETTRAFALEQLAVAGESDSDAAASCASDLRADDGDGCEPLGSVTGERQSAVHELGNLRAALDWALASADDRTLAYELLGKCWLVWMQNGLTDEGVQRMSAAMAAAVEPAAENRGGLLPGLCSAQQGRCPRRTLGSRASGGSAVSTTRRCGPARPCAVACRDDRCGERSICPRPSKRCARPRS